MKIRLLPVLLLFALLAAALPMVTPAHAAPVSATSAAKAKRVDALMIFVWQRRTSMRPSSVRTLSTDLSSWMSTASRGRLRLATRVVPAATTSRCSRTTDSALETLQGTRVETKRYDVVMVITDRRCRATSGADALTVRRGAPDVITVYGVTQSFSTVANAALPLSKQLRRVVPGAGRLALPAPPPAPEVTAESGLGFVGARWSGRGNRALPVRHYATEYRSASHRLIHADRALIDRQSSFSPGTSAPITIRVRTRDTFQWSRWTTVHARAQSLPSRLTIISPRRGSTITSRYLDVTVAVQPDPLWKDPVASLWVEEVAIESLRARKVGTNRWTVRVDLATTLGDDPCLSARARYADGSSARDAPQLCIFVSARFSAPTISDPAEGAELSTDEPLTVHVRPGTNRLTGKPAPTVAVSLQGWYTQYATVANGWTVTFRQWRPEPGSVAVITAESQSTAWIDSAEVTRTVTFVAPPEE